MRKMQPAGQGKRSPWRPGRGVRLSNVMTQGVAGARNSSAMVPEEVDVSVMPPVGEVGQFSFGCGVSDGCCWGSLG